MLWAAGVGASPLGASLGTPRDRAGRVIVEPDLSIPGHREVFVIGDLAAYAHQDGKPLPGVAPVAMQEAKYVAGAIESDLRKEPREPLPLSRISATSRRSAAPPRSPTSAGSASPAGSRGWLWLFVHIMMLIGFRNRVVVFTQWAWAYFTRQRAVRLITGEGAADEASPPPA